MRDIYLMRLRQERMHEASIKAAQDPEYQEIQKQIEELIAKRDEVLNDLTIKYYNEMVES